MLYKNIVHRKGRRGCSLISVFTIIWCIGGGQTLRPENVTEVPIPLSPPVPLPYSADYDTSQSNAAVRALLHLYEECSQAAMGIVPCLKKKAIIFIDRLSNFETINLMKGVKVVRSSMAKTVSNEMNLASLLSRSLDDRNNILTHLLLERIYHFLDQHALQVSLPKFSTAIMGRSMVEGRGKMKKMLHVMMMGMAMKMISMLPLAIGFLYILAGKAFLIAKIALLLSAIIIIKKLMQSKGGGGGGVTSSSWPSDNSGGWSSSGGGYERRSFAHDLAYRGYSQTEQTTAQKLLSSSSTKK